MKEMKIVGMFGTFLQHVARKSNVCLRVICVYVLSTEFYSSMNAKKQGHWVQSFQAVLKRARIARALQNQGDK
jgi:hypothetical protein